MLGWACYDFIFNFSIFCFCWLADVPFWVVHVELAEDTSVCSTTAMLYIDCSMYM